MFLRTCFMRSSGRRQVILAGCGSVRRRLSGHHDEERHRAYEVINRASDRAIRGS